ncbi:MAG: DUF3460 family protein [Betaproteobacteria bacterium]
MDDKINLNFPQAPGAIAMAMYESDITQFIRDLMDKNPQLKELQKQNRATWWDRKVDFQEVKRQEASEAPKQPYAYFPLPKA